MERAEGDLERDVGRLTAAGSVLLLASGAGGGAVAGRAAGAVASGPGLASAEGDRLLFFFFPSAMLMSLAWSRDMATAASLSGHSGKCELFVVAFMGICYTWKILIPLGLIRVRRADRVDALISVYNGYKCGASAS